jgi:hypothetical protein
LALKLVKTAPSSFDIACGPGLTVPSADYALIELLCHLPIIEPSRPCFANYLAMEILKQKYLPNVSKKGKGRLQGKTG